MKQIKEEKNRTERFTFYLKIMINNITENNYMKKIVRRITFQTVWLNVKSKTIKITKKTGHRKEPAAKISNLDTKVHENKPKRNKSRQKQLFYVSEQDKPDQCVISDFLLILFSFPLNTVTFNGQPSRFECGYLARPIIWIEWFVWRSLLVFWTLWFPVFKPSNRTFHFNDNRILYRLLSRFMTVTSPFWPVWKHVLECAEKIRNFTLNITDISIVSVNLLRAYKIHWNNFSSFNE